MLTFSLAYYDASSAGEVFTISDAPDGCIIVAILLASGFLGFWLEKSAADTVAKLVGLIETKATVLRDNEPAKVFLLKRYLQVLCQLHHWQLDPTRYSSVLMWSVAMAVQLRLGQVRIQSLVRSLSGLSRKLQRLVLSAEFGILVSCSSK